VAAGDESARKKVDDAFDPAIQPRRDRNYRVDCDRDSQTLSPPGSVNGGASFKRDSISSRRLT
jgi:hypothetical protein